MANLGMIELSFILLGVMIVLLGLSLIHILTLPTNREV